ncbi:MAG: hypothetical protein KAR44_00635 [Candidatus Aegiribacteria sp.]|nr:hypothetical protein [Candidatus Aegiribacteria sp.]
MSDTFTGETYTTLCIDAEGYLAKDSPEQARELLQKAISLIATRPRARSILADTCMSMELWAEARSQLEVLLTLDEGNISNNFKLAQVLEELGEYQLARDNYTVVLDDDPEHHGSKVAIKRIESRTKDSWVNLKDIFDTQQTDSPEEISTDKTVDEFKDGMQVFPDVPSEELFADSENAEEASVERLLKNIGLSGDSSEEIDDSSELLETIGVSTTETLQSAFGNTEDSEDELDTKVVEKKNVKSLDEIFGISSVAEEELMEIEPESEEPEEETEPEAEEPAELEEEAEPEAEEPAELEEEAEPEAEKLEEEKAEAEPYSFNSGKTLEAIFNAPEIEEPAEEEAEPVAEEPAEEEAEPEAEEPAEEEAEPEAEEPAEEETEPEAEEPAEEEAEPEGEEPAEEETVEEKEVITAVFKQDADLSIDPWSRESGLLTVHLKTGNVRVKSSMLTIYEKSLKVELSKDDILELSGEGTFLINCGSEEPLIVELKENMVIRKDAVAFHTGTITTELLDIPENDSLYVIKEESRERVIFMTDHPTRVILLGGNNRVFYVRTSSIIATDPEILLSSTGSPDGYIEITGVGKVYLIE